MKKSLVIPLKEILIGGGSHLIATVWINNFIARMIIDTGANETIFDEKRILNYLDEEKIEEAVKTVSGRVGSGIGAKKAAISETVLDKFQIGELCLYNHRATIMNLDSVSNAYVKLNEKPVEGILGSDFLRKYESMIIYADKSELHLFI